MGRYFCSKRVLLLLFALALFLPASTYQAQQSGASATPDHITLTWTGDPSTTVTISWRTDASVSRGLVQYQEGDLLGVKASEKEADGRDFVTDLGPSRIFTVTLTDLLPDKKYSYRVGDGEHWSKKHSFHTADPQVRSFKFLVFSDSQSSVSGPQPYGAWRDTVQKAYASHPDAKFMVCLGDLVDYGQKGAHWNAWFAASAGVIDSIPIMPVTGNHESYGSKDTTRPEYYLAQFALPSNGPEGLKGQVYSFDYGRVHFAVLDSQQEEQRKYGDILGVQKAWLDADLSASKAPWKIVFLHRPPYGIKADRPNEEIKVAFCPIIEKHRVDLVFSGHDHGIARTHPIRGGVYGEKPLQGTIYYVVGRSGDKTYTDISSMPWNAFFCNPLDQPNYFLIEVDGSKLTVNAIKQDGTVLDSFSIDKAKESDLDLPLVTKPAAFFIPAPEKRLGIEYLQVTPKAA